LRSPFRLDGWPVKGLKNPPSLYLKHARCLFIPVVRKITRKKREEDAPPVLLSPDSGHRESNNDIGNQIPVFLKSPDPRHDEGAAFLEHIDGLYSYALVLARNRSDADDLVQETCLRALPAMQRLREDSNVRAWLYTILRNIWFNQLRQRRTAPQIDSIDMAQRLADIPSNGSQDPYSLLAGKTEREQLRDAIQQLPIESREIIMLREYGELSYQEIADAIDVPIGTVMSRLGRARSKLRTLLLASSKCEGRPTPT
jgi:RNA polymerase sigma-70 factor, ECF subfamily